MRTKTSSSLKWLVDRRARLSCDIERDRKEAREATLRASTLEGKIELMRQDLAAIDRALSMHEIRIHPETIAPKKTWRTVQVFGYSHVTRNIMSYLGRARGRWCSTTELMAYVASRGGKEMSDELYPALRLSVRKRLQNLRVAGRVTRQHAAKTSKEGYWALPTNRPTGSKP